MFRYIIAVAAIAVVAVSCDHNTYTYEEISNIRSAEYDAGYKSGNLAGYEEGYSVGREMGESDGYEDGYRDAYAHIEERSDDFHQFLYDWYGQQGIGWGQDGCRELFGDWCDS